MYEGSLRLHESDPYREQYICLSRYRRYIKEDGVFVIKNDYASNRAKWVYLKMETVDRVEISYKEPK